MKIRPFFLCMVTFVCVFSSSVHAQYITITGYVIDKYERDTLWFAYVSVKNNRDSIPTVRTNENGYYSISVKPNDVLVFSCIGYISQEVIVDGRTTIDVEMDCEDCGRYFPGIWERQTAHDFSVLVTDVFNDWGCGFEYAYLPRISSSYGFFNKALRCTDLNFKVQGLSRHDSDWRIFPHIKISTPYSILLFSTRQKFVPFVSTGYYFDTNFKNIPRHNWGIGGGFKTRLAFIDFKGRAGRYMIISFTAGYTAYMGDKRKNSIDLGLRFYLSSVFFYE